MNSKYNKIISLSLTFLLLATLLNSAYFFMSMLKMNVLQWLTFNACSLAIIIYLLFFLLYRFKKSEFLLAVPILPMYYYGTMGLFIMPWNSSNIFAHITHIIITLNVIWILYLLLKDRKFDSVGKGLLFGTIIFVPVFAFIKVFTELHMSEFIEALQAL